jgi:hypothetical protein
MSAGGQYMGEFTTVNPTPVPTAAIAAYGNPKIMRPRYRRRTLSYLGQAAAPNVEAIISQVNPKHDHPDDATMQQAITGMQLTPGYTDPSQCAQAGTGTGKASRVESAVGASVMSVGGKIAAANPLVGGIVAAAGAIVSLIGAITGHHAQAVANEQTILCQAVPATNQALGAIISAVQGGQMSASDGAAALQQVLSAFQSAVKPITKSCNEACGLIKELQAIVLYLTQEFQSMPEASAVPSTGMFGGALSGTIGGIPIWAIAAGAAAILLLG